LWDEVHLSKVNLRGALKAETLRTVEKKPDSGGGCWLHLSKRPDTAADSPGDKSVPVHIKSSKIRKAFSEIERARYRNRKKTPPHAKF